MSKMYGMMARTKTMPGLSTTENCAAPSVKGMQLQKVGSQVGYVKQVGMRGKPGNAKAPAQHYGHMKQDMTTKG